MAPPVGGADYRASGVVFFTRDAGGVQRVLLALEERRVSDRQLGLAAGAAGAAGGRAVREVVVFPQGRRERKDEGDPVETAMREYHEETGNFGALTEHLLRFYEDEDADGAGGEKPPGGGAASAAAESPAVSSGQSFIMYFGHARMVVVFCEVPATAYERTLRPLSREDFPAGREQAESSEAPPEKRPRRGSATSYHVGKENHLTPVWVSADALRRAVTSLDADGAQRCVTIEATICPRPSVDGTGQVGTSEPGAAGGERRVVPFFPLNLSVLRQREARAWLGLLGPGAGGGEAPAGGSAARGSHEPREAP